MSIKLFKIKRYLFAVSTKTEYTLLGVRGFSDKHVKRKLEKLIKYGVIELDERFGVDREVSKFPSYCTWVI